MVHHWPLVIKGRREAVPSGIELRWRRVGRHGRRDGGGVALVQGIPIEEGACSVLRDVAAGRSLLVESCEEGVLPLAPFHAPDALSRSLCEIGSFLPDAGEGMVAALADRPDDDRHRHAIPRGEEHWCKPDGS